MSEPENSSAQHDDDVDDDGSERGIEQPEEQQSKEKSNKLPGNVDKKASGAAPVILGGSIKTSAFCLLQGFMEDPDEKSSPNGKNPTKQRILVPINRLPAMLGRSHNTTDRNFFGLGKNIKAVSRVQFCIEYRIPSGKIGQVLATDGTSKFTYQPDHKKKKNSEIKGDADEKEQVILNPTNAPKDETGFYVITCKGKNPIRVNGLKVDQDQTCLLIHGSDIKISTFCLYFLLPSKPSTKTMQVTVPNSGGERKSKGNDDQAHTGGNGVTDAAASLSKKRKAPPEMLISTGTAATTATPQAAKRRRFPNQSLQDDLDNMTTDELLNEMDEAAEKGIWDRRCGFMGSTILYRAVREAAQARLVQENLEPNGGGMSKAQIVGWIHSSAKFGSCTQYMQTQLEKKSYQCSIARSMQRAGYTRCGDKSCGRHVRWLLPANIEQTYVRSPGHRDTGGKEEDPAGANEDDNDEDDDDNSASQEDHVADGNEKDSDIDDDDDDNDDDDGGEGSDGVNGGAWKRIKAEIDALSTEQLLEEFNQAVANDRWDRRCQFVASTVALRAVNEAARAADFRKSAEPDGVSRAQVVDWITESARFGKWAVYMSDKLKPRSYQANIVKSMQLAGYHRSSVKTFGCNIRWYLPDVPVDDEEEEEEEDDNDDDDGGGGDNNADGDESGSDVQSQGSAAGEKEVDSDNGSGSDDSDDDDGQ